MFKFLALSCVAFATLTGCASLPRQGSIETVKITRGGCFGFCPVYELEAMGGRNVVFRGLRHTAFVGVRQRQVQEQAVASLLLQLEPFRPTSATANFICASSTTDQAEFQISWGRSSTNRRTTLTFNSGCQSLEAKKLRALLEGAPRLVGFGPEAAQVTRPGASRG